MEHYEPELGQFVFGQPHQEFKCPEFVRSFLKTIRDELNITMWNINQREYESPFDNTSNHFKNNVFEVEAYSWNEEYDQPYNFKWRDFEVSWYKYLGRGMSINREITAKEGAEMLNECLDSIYEMDRKWLKEIGEVK